MKDPPFTLRGQLQKLTFLKTTNIKKCLNYSGSKFGFSFVDYPSILSNDKQEHKSIDVIGILVSRSPIIVSPTGEKKWMDIHIENLEGDQLKITLWSALAYEMLNYVEKNANDAPVIVIVQFGKKNIWKGEISVSSWFNYTKLFINSEIDEINDFKKSFLARNGETQSSSAIIMIPSKAVSIHDDFLVNHDVIPIKQILDPVEIQKFIVLVTIVSIRQDMEWNYSGCLYCRFSVKEKWISTDQANESVSEDIKVFECTDCKKTSTTFVPRFKIPLVVQDEDGTVMLTLFDRDAEGMLKTTCKDLVEQTTANGFDTKLYPADLNKLKKKHLAFKVSIGRYNIRTGSKQYSISRVTEDKEIIQELTKKIAAKSEKPINECIVKFESASQDSNEILLETAENCTPISVDRGTATDPALLLTSAKDLKRKFEDAIDVEDHAASSSTKEQNEVEGDYGKKMLLIPKIEK